MKCAACKYFNNQIRFVFIIGIGITYFGAYEMKCTERQFQIQ